jgi:GNAT superfamily N-acetyltransferase
VSEFSSRLATLDDLPALTAVAEAAIVKLQRAFLGDAQIEASRAVMGIDTELIEDGTYFVIESEGEIAGCGGWSRRATLYGSDETAGRDSRPLDPRTEAARVRAMYTHPSFARRGVGRLILSLCEQAAAAEGFRRMELMATLSGEPLYTACGFRPLERVADATGGSGAAPVPCVRMEKPIDPALLDWCTAKGTLGRPGEPSRRRDRAERANRPSASPQRRDPSPP